MNRALTPIDVLRRMSAGDLVRHMQKVDNKSIEEEELLKHLTSLLGKWDPKFVNNRNTTKRGILKNGEMV